MRASRHSSQPESSPKSHPARARPVAESATQLHTHPTSMQSPTHPKLPTSHEK
jgi:hypothetical protein